MSQLEQHRPLSEFDHFFRKGLLSVKNVPDAVEHAIIQEQAAYDCDTYDSEGGETHMSDFSRFHRPGFYQEEDQLSDDKDITVGDLDLENDDDDQSPDELPGYLEGRMSDEDRNKFNETENMDPNDVELGSFGSDNSDVQNDYDQKDVDTLMKLMASEADALGEYLEAAKETNTDVLRRLYADIGDEERFHMEQLLFAKSELTGEKYTPKDPDVKKEYEELLAMGMDEETAMQTAVDKCHIRVSSDSDDDKSFEESISELEDNIKNLQETFEMINVTSEIILEAYESNKTSPYVTPIMECAFYQEAFGEADPKWDPSTSINPFKLLATLIGKGITLILKTVSSFRKVFNKLRNRSRYARAFLNDHGPGAIFQQGVHLYFEPQMARDGSAQLDPIVWKWFLCVGNLHDACIESLRGIAGLNIVNPQGHLMNAPSARIFFNDASVLQCRRSISAGIAIINKLDLIRTKVPVGHNDIERQTMFEYLTGYTDAKNGAGKSNNMFNSLYMISDLWKGMMVIVQGNLNVLSDQKNIVGSTYNKNVSKNDIAYDSLKTCVKTCQSFVKCLTSDMTEIARVCKKVYRNMTAEDNRDIETNYNGAGDLNNAYENSAGPVRAAADQMKKNRWR